MKEQLRISAAMLLLLAIPISAAASLEVQIIDCPGTISRGEMLSFTVNVTNPDC